MTDERVEMLAREAMENRFRTRLATEDQRNGYEVGWYEGHLAALDNEATRSDDHCGWVETEQRPASTLLREALERIAELHPLKTGNELADYRREIARKALNPPTISAAEMRERLLNKLNPQGASQFEGVLHGAIFRSTDHLYDADPDPNELIAKRANDVTVALTEALLEELPLDEDADGAGIARWGDRADKLIIEALTRSNDEPTEEMIEAGVRVLDTRQQHGTFREDVRAIYKAMAAIKAMRSGGKRENNHIAPPSK